MCPLLKPIYWNFTRKSRSTREILIYLDKASITRCTCHHQTRLYFSKVFRAAHRCRSLIKKRFTATSCRTREGTTRGFGTPDTPAGLRSYATRLGKRVCQNAFFHFCPHGLATDCNCRTTAILPYTLRHFILVICSRSFIVLLTFRLYP